MKKSLKYLALGATATVLAGVGVGSMVSSAQAALIQIDDNTDVLSLYVDNVLVTGNGGNISGYLNTIDPITLTERLEFTFRSAVASAVDVKQYTQMFCTNCEEETLTGGLSDIFLYSTTVGSFEDKITFLSSDTASVLAPPPGFTPSSFNPLEETGNFQTVFRTISGGNVVDTYQARSLSTPEPSSMLGLFALGTLGAGATLKRKLKPSQSTEKETTKVS